jgi:hypothetical protein
MPRLQPLNDAAHVAAMHATLSGYRRDESPLQQMRVGVAHRCFYEHGPSARIHQVVRVQRRLRVSSDGFFEIPSGSRTGYRCANRFPRNARAYCHQPRRRRVWRNAWWWQIKPSHPIAKEDAESESPYRGTSDCHSFCTIEYQRYALSTRNCCYCW